ncbi:MAG: glycosyltransferase [Marinosulfonomonas sp.]|nr:glycosyltransferase [Marinosulfonomonas sp.]
MSAGIPKEPKECPRVIFALLAYNQEKFIREAVESALTQTYQPLEIILSDDCSSDQTFEIIKTMVAAYDGPHKVIIQQNPTNIGLIEHVNKVAMESNSDFIVVAAGDDISKPNRTCTLVEAWQLTEALLVYSKADFMDQNGNRVTTPRNAPGSVMPKSLKEFALSRSKYIGATGAWDKKLFADFGRITETGSYEDLVLAYRAKLIGKLHHVDEALVIYRQGVGITSNFGNKLTHRSERFLDKAAKRTVFIAVLWQRLRDTTRVRNHDIKLRAILLLKIARFYVDRLLLVMGAAVFNGFRSLKKLLNRY